MLNNSLNKEWKEEFFEIFATKQDDVEELEKADKLKFEHFPPVIGNFYESLISEEELRKVCNGKLKLQKAKLDPNYNDNILKVDYLKIIKEQLNGVTKQQLANLHQEDPNFLNDEEKEIINSSEFPFVKLMTLVYVKDTDEMTEEEQNEWKTNMNEFINQQIIFGVVNVYYTMKLYHDNNYIRLFQTPYNKKGVWEDYADNNKGFCVVYDFKEISEDTASQLNKLYPVLYVDHKIEENELDFDVYNAHCSSLLKIKEEVKDYDNEWMYIFNRHYKEAEYEVLNSFLKPIYDKTLSSPEVMAIMKTNYLISEDNDLNYDYQKLMDDLLAVLSSEKFNKENDELLNELYNISKDTMEIDFLKPEALYLGSDFPEDKLNEYKRIVEEENIRIFKIKESEDGKLFKSFF